MKILYGIINNYLDCSNLVKSTVQEHYFPAGDFQRNQLYSDPLPGIIKHLLVTDDFGEQRRLLAGQEGCVERIDNCWRWKKTKRFYPIGFSIPEEKILSTELEEVVKKRLLAHLLPGQLSTYIYTSEQQYYAAYQESYFALTMCKAGWDCMRHYEIMARGCLPHFQSLQQCPPEIMTFVCKDLLLQASALFEQASNELSNKVTSNELSENLLLKYTALRREILHHLRTKLTCRAMSTMVLTRALAHANKSSTGLDQVRVLFLSNDSGGDYLRCLTLIGLKQVLSTRCTDYPQVKHIYTDYALDVNRLYGKGMSYTKCIEPHHRDSSTTKQDIVQQLMKRSYDLIIYGSLHRGLPLKEEVDLFYRPEEIVYLCGEDRHQCYEGQQLLAVGSCVFVREQ
jgi:hypothetical protein